MRNFITPRSQLCKLWIRAASFLVSTVSLVLFLLTNPSHSKQTEYYSELNQVESYLNSIQNLSADFVQKTSDGNSARGKFYLARPGKMRIEYLANPKLLVMVNGSVLTYQDLELDEISHLPTNTTPAALLTRKNISFAAADIEIISVTKHNNQITISLQKKDRKEAGEFSLTFSLNPVQFIQMEVENDLDQSIAITLENIEMPIKLSSSLFRIKNKNLP